MNNVLMSNASHYIIYDPNSTSEIITKVINGSEVEFINVFDKQSNIDLSLSFQDLITQHLASN